MNKIHLACLLLCLISLPPGISHAATITLAITDGPDTGFNDPTPRLPVLNNPGTTLGEQRILAFEAAVIFWENKIDSDVEIIVEASFAPLFCNSNSAVLGSAGPALGRINFPNAPRQDTVYPVALANSLAGVDMEPGEPDIIATFNSNIDLGVTGCNAAFTWDYRIDPPNPSDLTVASTVLHELGHGLGFTTFVNRLTGEKPAGIFDDSYMVYLRDELQNKSWPDMTNAQRAASATNNGNLVWTGPKAVAQSSFLSAGLQAGKPRLYAPSTLVGGSSIAHWDTALQPNDLMEPFAAVPQENWLTLKAMYDMGWSGNPCLKTELPSGQWIMFSLDCLPPAGENTVQIILGDDIQGAYEDTWVMYEFDDSILPAGGYRQLLLTDPLELAKGYWLIQLDSNPAATLDLPDNSGRTPSPVACSGRQCTQTPLQTVSSREGYTFIGNPFRNSIALEGWLIRTNSGTCSVGCNLSVADANGIVFPTVFAYNTSTESYDELAIGDRLSARTGAWMATVAGSDGLLPQLLMPR